MPEMRLKQMQYENETRKRLLGFMSDENIQLKNRLSEVLKNNFDTRLLEEMENFHSNFLKEDERISLLKLEVTSLDKLLVKDVLEEGSMIRLADHKLKKLRNNLKIEAAKFTRLKNDFNAYLSEHVIQNK